MKTYEILESISELKIRIHGSSISELFENALKSMFECTSPIYKKNGDELKLQISLTAPDQEQLLIDFLAEALYLSDSRNLAFFAATFDSLSKNSLQGTLIGREILGLALEIKAVTYHGVHISMKDDIISTDILFDI